MRLLRKDVTANVLRKLPPFVHFAIISSSSKTPHSLIQNDSLSYHPSRFFSLLHEFPENSLIYSIRNAKNFKTVRLSDVEIFHSQVIKRGLSQIQEVVKGLLNLYCKCRQIGRASQLFEEMSVGDVFTWTVLISTCAIMGLFEAGSNLFCQMLAEGIQPNCFTLASVFKCYAGDGNLGMGKKIHGWVLRRGIEFDVVLANSIVDLYVKCGVFAYAERVFELMNEKDTVSWNIMISAFLQIGNIDKSMDLFRNLPYPDVASWNTIISGQMQNGFDRRALELLYEMGKAGPRFNKFTFSVALGLAAALALLELGRQVHAQLLRTGFGSDSFIRVSLIDMYCKCMKVETAATVFNNTCLCSMTLEISKVHNNGSSILWSSMISGYVQNGRSEDALKLCCIMLQKGIKMSPFTLTSIASACADAGTLEQGRQIHATIEKCGPKSDVVLTSAIIDMYSKCGSIQDAQAIFDRTADRNIVLWTSIINGCALHGQVSDAIRLFELMLKESIMPNEVSFVGVLSACAHSGLVEEGQKYFKSMQENYGIIPGVEHLTCMVDLFGRAGQLQEAKDFIMYYGISHSSVAWRALLSACRIHKKIDMGRWASERLVQLEPSDAGSYILLSNMCATTLRWEEAAKMRKLMRDRGIKKDPGQSWIQLKSKVHTFVVGDQSHPQTNQIYTYLEMLIGRIKEIGYSTEVNSVLQDVEEEQRESFLSYHSEKLAIAYGIMSTPSGSSIRVMKNLRVCADCHSAIKYMSLITGREIILRDAHRFHHFKEGKCSCSEFW
ncbi:pentatricopeptide repeat-containing protein At5g04780, mitochondrial-like [Aristolochia californica]|uniref:pentatricopeptide repeat-containing protein At5g04780, mitochondrial-like n=1 Tax=Aristolochia californica TaxID=171875 RepID=UPI0035DD521E